MQPPCDHPVTPTQPSCNHHNRHAITMQPSCNHHATITRPPYNHQAKAPCNCHFVNHPPTHLGLAVRRSTRARVELDLGSDLASIKPLHCTVTMHRIASYNLTLHYITLHYNFIYIYIYIYLTLHGIILNYIAFHYITLQCIPLH